MRLVQEYIATIPGAKMWFTRLRVGNLHPSLKTNGLSDEELRVLGNFRRWIDGAVIMEDRIILIEGKILPSLGDISQLECYKELLPYTPELEQFKNLTIVLQYVTPVLDPYLKSKMLEKGIQYVIFRPAWIEEYLTQQPNTKRLITSTANK
jgi:hypothetical protein